MATLWFCLVAVMLAVYVVLDGFDLGAGIVHLLVARTDAERRQVLRSIGPVWDGNEVWLLAGGGTLYFAFPGALCLQLQRLLSAADDRALAADSARHLHRVSQPRREPRLAASLGRRVRRLERPAGDLLRRRAGQRGARRAARCRRRFLPAAVDRFPAGKDAGILDWYTIWPASRLSWRWPRMARSGSR